MTDTVNVKFPLRYVVSLFTNLLPVMYMVQLYNNIGFNPNEESPKGTNHIISAPMKPSQKNCQNGYSNGGPFRLTTRLKISIPSSLWNFNFRNSPLNFMSPDVFFPITGACVRILIEMLSFLLRQQKSHHKTGNIKKK